MAENIAVAVDPYQERFQFLYPSGVNVPRYRLHPPDFLEPRWSVFDRVEKTTIGFGRTPEDAVDVAFSVAERNRVMAPALPNPESTSSS